MSELVELLDPVALPLDRPDPLLPLERPDPLLPLERPDPLLPPELSLLELEELLDGLGISSAARACSGRGSAEDDAGGSATIPSMASSISSFINSEASGGSGIICRRASSIISVQPSFSITTAYL